MFNQGTYQNPRIEISSGAQLCQNDSELIGWDGIDQYNYTHQPPLSPLDIDISSSEFFPAQQMMPRESAPALLTSLHSMNAMDQVAGNPQLSSPAQPYMLSVSPVNSNIHAFPSLPSPVMMPQADPFQYPNSEYSPSYSLSGPSNIPTDTSFSSNHMQHRRSFSSLSSWSDASETDPFRSEHTQHVRTLSSVSDQTGVGQTNLLESNQIQHRRSFSSRLSPSPQSLFPPSPHRNRLHPYAPGLPRRQSLSYSPSTPPLPLPLRVRIPQTLEVSRSPRYKVDFKRRGTPGIPLKDAMNDDVVLDDASSRVFDTNGSRQIRLVIAWPGYPSKGSYIAVQDKNGYITRAQFAKAVASHISRYVDKCNRQHVDPDQARWAIGKHGIHAEDLWLLSVVDATQNIWVAEIEVQT